MSTVADGKVVLFHYTLTDDEGAVLDTSRDGRDPMPYLHGAGNIVPGLESQLTGKGIGDRFTASIPPEEGYGTHNGMGPQAVPRDQFPDEIPLEEGIQLLAQGPEGRPVPVWIARVDDAHVYLETNHPLAGKTLHFDVEVMGIRAATADEQAHGHPHGPDGHHHH